MERSKDLLHFMMHMKQFKNLFVGIPLDQWLMQDDCYALTNGEDYGLFEWFSPGVYTGHYFCTSKGRSAINFSKEAIAYMFTETDCNVIRGLTPVGNRAALWMNRHLGFKSYDVLDTDIGPHEVFILTKKEWETS